MKGFTEIRGQMFRMSYDANAGAFVAIAVAHASEDMKQSLQSVPPPVYLRPKPETVALHQHEKLKRIA